TRSGTWCAPRRSSRRGRACNDRNDDALCAAAHPRPDVGGGAEASFDLAAGAADAEQRARGAGQTRLERGAVCARRELALSHRGGSRPCRGRRQPGRFVHGLVAARAIGGAAHPALVLSDAEVALIPVLAIWLGFGDASKITLIFLGCLLPITMGA